MLIGFADMKCSFFPAHTGSSDMNYSSFAPFRVSCHERVWGLQAYVDRYDYEHIPIAGAVDEHEGQGGVAFSLSVDRQVHPKPSAYKEQHEAGEAVPTDTTGRPCSI
jgi:hypothetical protein